LWDKTNLQEEAEIINHKRKPVGYSKTFRYRVNRYATEFFDTYIGNGWSQAFQIIQMNALGVL